MTWKDVEWLRTFSRVPLVLKGVLTGDDAERAVSSGADGLIVSNHGGRNLDTSPATIDALPEVAETLAVPTRAELERELIELRLLSFCGDLLPKEIAHAE